MKTVSIRQPDEKDGEITDALISLGGSRYAARTLTYLRNVDEASSSELEKCTGLCQPEVSIAVKLLKERGWIKVREEKKTGKGRPYRVLSLNTGFDGIIAQLEDQHELTAHGMWSKIGRLREIAGSRS